MGEPFTTYIRIPREPNETGIADAITFNAAMDFLDNLFNEGSLFGDKSWKAPVADFASLPATGNTVGDIRQTLDDGVFYRWDGVLWKAISEALLYLGVWDASTNTPFISDATGSKGSYYVVSVGGTQDLGSGPISFAPGDWAVHNGVKWEKADHTDAVSSVFGRLGAVVAQSGDYTHAQISGVGPDDHHAQIHGPSHQDGGGDEINVTGLTGLLATPQLPNAPLQASATGITTTTGATDGLLAGMTLTPGAGNYLVWFSTTVDHDSTNNTIWVSLYVNGVQVAHTEREFRRGGSGGDIQGGLAFNAYITGVGDGEAVEVRWRTTAATASAYERTLNLLKVA